MAYCYWTSVSQEVSSSRLQVSRAPQLTFYPYLYLYLSYSMLESMLYLYGVLCALVLCRIVDVHGRS